MNNENRVLLWTALGHFMNHIGNYLTPALLIYLQTDIPLTQTERGILGSIPMIMLVFLTPVVGRMGDLKPSWKKTLIWTGIAGLGIFSLIMAVAQSFFQLAIGTVVLGIGLASFHPIAFTYLNTIPNRDMNMGIFAVAGNFGSAITPLVAMVIAILEGWRFSFLVFTGILVVAGISIALFFPNDETFSENNENLNSKEIEYDSGFTISQIRFLVLLLALISATRGPIFRCINYFTIVVFSDEFMFTEIESSVFTAIVLGIGSFASFFAGYINNMRIKQGQSNKDERVNFRVNMMMISVSLTTIFLIIITFISLNAYILLLVYLSLAFVFFLGASVLPPIVSEITGYQRMSSAFGVTFTGATLAGAIAPTIFGFLADTYGFSASFAFLVVVGIICVLVVVAFKMKYARIIKYNQKNRNLSKDP